MTGTGQVDLEKIVAIDFHTHAEVGRTGEDGLLPEWREAAQAYFGEGATPTVEDVADYYRERSMLAVVFTVDAETVTGRAAVRNEEILEVAAANPDVLVPFASVDPHRPNALEEVRRLIRDTAVRGFKFHPNVQAFFPNDRAFYPLYAAIEEAGLPALFHTGHSGIGTGLPGGGGIRLKYSNPMHVDDVAVDFPALKIVLAHPSFPGRTRRSPSRCTSSRSTSTSRAGRRSTSRRSSCATRIRSSATACSSAPTTRSSRPTAGSPTSRRPTSRTRYGR